MDVARNRLNMIGPAVGISLAVAMALAAAEVLVHVHTAREVFNPQQFALGISANVAVVGAVGLGVCTVVLSITAVLPRRFFMAVGGTPQRAASAAACAAAVVCAALTEWAGLHGTATIAGPLSAFAAGAFALGLSSRSAGSGPGLRRRMLWIAPMVAWAVAAAGSSVYAFRTDARIEQWVSAGLEAPPTAAGKRPNVILIVIDTLRADRVGVYGGGSLTPHLDRLADSALVYKNAISTAPWTLPAHASLFTGLYPETVGVSWGHYWLDDRFDTLAEFAGSVGYETFAVSNNWLLDASNGFAQGFDAFLETSTDSFLSAWRLALRCKLPRTLASRLGLGESVAEDAGAAWTNWLLHKRLQRRAPSQRPFFMFVNYYEPHDPYFPPERFGISHLSEAQRRHYHRFHQQREDLIVHACGLSETFTRDEVELMAALYDAEVAYQDEMIGTLIQDFSERGLLEDSWLIVTSDHGELFGEGDPEMTFHTAGSHYKLLHVPLIVRPPGGVPHRMIEKPVQPVDVFVTLAEQMGVAVPGEVQHAVALPFDTNGPDGRTVCVAQTFGASLVGLAITQQRRLQADLSHWLTWVTSVYSDGYLMELAGGVPRALFDVQGDPEMRNDVLHERPEVADALNDRYCAEMKRTAKRTGCP